MIGDARHLPLKDKSVNCIITSPPYWSLRKYDIPNLIWDGEEGCEHGWGEILKGKGYGRHDTNDPTSTNFGGYKDWSGDTGNEAGQFCLHCSAWRGQLGLEPTIDLYLKHLMQIMDECKRVLRDDGTMWVNLGDSYSGSGKAGSNPEYQKRHTEFGKPSVHGQRFGNPTTNCGIPPKSLCLIPERFAIEMANKGWILRNRIIWHKPNCMPSSVKDRFTVDFESVFFFTKSNDTQYWTNEKTGRLVGKQPLGTKGIEGEDWEWREVSGKRKKTSLWSGHDYWFEQQYEPINIGSIRRERRGNRENKYSKDDAFPVGVHANTMSQVREYRGYDGIEEEYQQRHGRNRRCVWTIPTQPYPESHFATFPEKLIEPMILAGCPKEICVKCGKAKEKIIKTEFPFKRENKRNKTPKIDMGKAMPEVPEKGWQSIKTEIGLTDCGCNAGFRPGVVLDPFAGSGTTMMVAEKLNRIGIGFDLGYEDLQKKRMKTVDLSMLGIIEKKKRRE